eukprot:14023025-Ditylum_brightwellii.AAC.1
MSRPPLTSNLATTPQDDCNRRCFKKSPETVIISSKAGYRFETFGSHSANKFSELQQNRHPDM